MEEVQQFMNQFLQDAVNYGLGEWLVNPNRGIYGNVEYVEIIRNLEKVYNFSIESGTYRHTCLLYTSDAADEL